MGNYPIIDSIYNPLLEKYNGYSFNNEYEENEYLNHLNIIINDNSIEFELKWFLLNMLIAGIRTKKYGIVPNQRDSK